MSPERWLMYFEPVVTIGAAVDCRIPIAITAKLRGDWEMTSTISID